MDSLHCRTHLTAGLRNTLVQSEIVFTAETVSQRPVSPAILSEIGTAPHMTSLQPPDTSYSCKVYCWKKPRLEACSRQHGSFEDEQGIGVHKDKENGASIQVPTFLGYRA